MLGDNKEEYEMAANLPIKTRVLEWCILNDRPICARELTAILQKEYPGEAHVNEKRIDNTLDCYCRVGFMEPASLNNELGEDLVEYRITEAGKEELKYIPGHGNKAF